MSAVGYTHREEERKEKDDHVASQGTIHKGTREYIREIALALADPLKHPR